MVAHFCQQATATQKFVSDVPSMKTEFNIYQKWGHFFTNRYLINQLNTKYTTNILLNYLLFVFVADICC